MTTIIAARFDTHSDVDETVGALRQAGFADHDIQVFFVTPPGQHHVRPTGGDEYADEQAEEAGKSALRGAAVGAGAGALAGVGALAGAVGGPLGTALGAGVGAYTGSLAGTLRGMKDEPAEQPVAPGEQAPIRMAGEHVAVHAESPEQQQRAIEILYAHNGQHVERAEGTWRDGSWVDFDPLAAPIIAERGTNRA